MTTTALSRPAAAAASASTTGQLHERTGTLAPTPPFDLTRSLAFLGHFPPTAGEQHVAPALLRKALRVHGQTLLAEVRATGTTDAPSLAYRLLSEQPIESAARDAALDRLSFFLSLDDDLCPFYALAASDPHFAPVATRLRGLHQVKFPSAYEIAAWAILTQRTRISVARIWKQKLMERLGGQINYEGTTYFAFPEPADVLHAGPEEIDALLGKGPRAERVFALADSFARIDDHFLRTAPYEQVETWLRGLPGIGPWSAAFILLRGLGRTEGLPVEEARMEQAAERVYGRKMDARELARTGARYGHYLGYWAHYIRADEA